MVTEKQTNELITELRRLVDIKQQYKDINVAIHEIATKLTLKYLEKNHPEIKTWYSNPRAGIGIDVFGPTKIEPQVVAEVTAHDPILKTRGRSPRFGAMQHQRMQEIISKLLREKQAKKYLFVISERAEMAIAQEFKNLQDIQVKNLFGEFG